VAELAPVLGWLLVLGVALLLLWPLARLLRSRPGPDAERRAELLVRDVLDDGEYTQLKRSGYIDVPSRARPGRIYRVPAAGSPVAVIEPGRQVVFLCLQPQDRLPTNEVVVIHKLMLEAAEGDYWRKANVLTGRGVEPRARA
jgi:hypothetical protein